MATSTEERKLNRTRKIVEQNTRLHEALLVKLLVALLGLWGGFKGWDNPALVSGQAARSASLVDASLARSRRIMRSYAETLLRDADAAPAKMPPQQDFYPRSVETMLDVYSRPAEVYLYEISRGKTDAEATKAAMQRLTDLATMDTALAKRDAADDVFVAAKKKKVIGFRRVIHPEKSASGTCGLCVVAATQFYHTGTLMPIHYRCKCEPMPIFKDADPGLALNKYDLDEIYAAAGSTAMEDLKKTRVTVKENGELGPVLVRQGQNFRDVKEVNRTASGKEFTPFERPTLEQQRAQWQATQKRSRQAITALKEARDSGDKQVSINGYRYTVKDWDAAIRNHQDLIARMARKLT